MILTKCAYCAAPNALTKCGHCKTRYCGRDCQKLHWKGGHRAICQEIKRGGGAERYHANKKCTEAVALAVEKCAEDTKGQRCYICLEGGSEEGLVRGCACRGGSGFAHVSCLAEQAKILYSEAEENNLGLKVKNERFKRWYSCSLCEQEYHGVVLCALGWACWKTYVGQPERDPARYLAMQGLGHGLSQANCHDDALFVARAHLSAMQRFGASGDTLLAAQSNLSSVYFSLGREDEALAIDREVYSGTLRLNGEDHKDTILAANNYARTLNRLQRFEEAKSLSRKMMLVARRVLGESNEVTLKIRWHYATAFYLDPAASLGDLREAVTTLEDMGRIARRVLGGAHPLTEKIEGALRTSRGVLAVREGDDVSAVCAALDAINAPRRQSPRAPG